MSGNPVIKKNTAVLVLGFGVTGKAAAKYFHHLGARVYVSDARKENELTVDEKILLKEICVDYEMGGHSNCYLDFADALFISPGIPDNISVLQEALEKDIAVVGELAVVSQVITSKVIGVTGTNGKTTVTTLIADLLKASNKKVLACGNIGRPLFDFLHMGKQPDNAVVEISSFQLLRAANFRPDIAILLNITPDHLDRHGSLAEYIRAKAKIFENQTDEDTAIICTDNTLCKELADNLHFKPLTFGHSMDCDAFICESEIHLSHQGQVEIYDLDGTVFDNIAGRLNCAASILAARTIGCQMNDILLGLKSFTPLPHRLEFVAAVDGVTYCNDSKATNTGAVISALQQSNGSVILIAGGKDKGEDYRLLHNAVALKVRRLILIGEAANAISDGLGDLAVVDFAASLEEAVLLASRHAVAGETVLLSPACASFDMFESYGHRGQVFKDCVMRLKSGSLEVNREQQ